MAGGGGGAQIGPRWTAVSQVRTTADEVMSDDRRQVITQRRGNRHARQRQGSETRLWFLIPGDVEMCKNTICKTLRLREARNDRELLP